MSKKLNSTKIRHTRLRKRISGTTERPRLAVHFSGKNIYAQIIDDTAGATLAAANTTEADFRTAKTTRANKATAEQIGKALAERAKAKKVVKVVFDRGGFLYHGKVKALADAARAGGLDF
ncbi:MAG: large subunit ribosomal protein [Chthoniobacter sp.]|jgi:large subunit ribosomal protein L18|nr:large subunit ribosomal protein [Chthoniobacter sp.]